MKPLNHFVAALLLTSALGPALALPPRDGGQPRQPPCRRRSQRRAVGPERPERRRNHPLGPPHTQGHLAPRRAQEPGDAPHDHGVPRERRKHARALPAGRQGAIPGRAARWRVLHHPYGSRTLRAGSKRRHPFPALGHGGGGLCACCPYPHCSWGIDPTQTAPALKRGLTRAAKSLPSTGIWSMPKPSPARISEGVAWSVSRCVGPGSPIVRAGSLAERYLGSLTKAHPPRCPYLTSIHPCVQADCESDPIFVRQPNAQRHGQVHGAHCRTQTCAPPE